MYYHPWVLEDIACNSMACDLNVWIRQSWAANHAHANGCKWNLRIEGDPVTKDSLTEEFVLQAVDISPNPGRSDPMYVVYSRKASTAWDTLERLMMIKFYGLQYPKKMGGRHVGSLML
jgi:hypothetical protein